MQAMIFAAGKGTRLKPLTDTRPKALVEVNGIPLIKYVIDKLYASGFKGFVINVHHFADMIETQVPQLISNTDVSLYFSDERSELLETGGGIKHAAQQLSKEDRFLIHNCDILSNVNIADFWERGKDADATLLVSQRDTQRYLVFDDDMRLVGWTNIKTGEIKSPYPELNSQTLANYRLLAFAGIHQMKTSLLTHMQSWPDKFSIIDFYLNMCSSHVIKGHIQEDLQIIDVGKLDTLSQAEQFLAECKNP